MSRGFLCYSDLYILKNTLDLGFESGNLKEKTFVDSISHNTKMFCPQIIMDKSFADNCEIHQSFFPLEFTVIVVLCTSQYT